MARTGRSSGKTERFLSQAPISNQTSVRSFFDRLKLSSEERQRELKWAQELYQSRRTFVTMVESVTKAGLAAKRRKEIYLEWKSQHGQVIARGLARFAEAVLAGEVSLDPIKEMIQQPPNPQDYE